MCAAARKEVERNYRSFATIYITPRPIWWPNGNLTRFSVSRPKLTPILFSRSLRVLLLFKLRHIVLCTVFPDVIDWPYFSFIFDKINIYLPLKRTSWNRQVSIEFPPFQSFAPIYVQQKAIQIDTRYFCGLNCGGGCCCWLFYAWAHHFGFFRTSYVSSFAFNHNSLL